MFFISLLGYRQRAAHLLDTLAHADETKAPMPIGHAESFSIILEFESNCVFVEVEPHFEPAGVSIFRGIR
jgi:hypothetical protein